MRLNWPVPKLGVKSKKKLIVHIGHPKTGTSTIQKALVHNASTLRQYGLCYPEFGQKFNAHHLLVNALVSHKNDNFLPSTDITGDQIVKEFRRLSADPTLETIIISSEAFVSAIGFKAPFVELERMFDLHIVWIVRSPTEYSNSMANQRIRMGFFQRGIDFSRVTRDTLNLVEYGEKAHLWRDRFPGARFSVASMVEGFDTWDFFSREVHSKLLQLERPKEKSNVSLAPEALAFLLRMQRQDRKRSNMESSRIVSMLEDYTKTSEIYPRNVTVIPPDIQAKLLRKFEKTGEKLEAMFPGFDPEGLAPREREYVDLAAMPSEHLMRVYDYCLECYNRHVDFLRR